VIHQSNQGLAAARNRAIAAASAKYILPLDSDNKLHRNYLTRAVEILDVHPSLDVVYGNPILFGEESGVRRVGPFEFGKLRM
jgi:glycosyltransferase involved in cell wall biosynthesis